VNYISRDQALATFQQNHANDQTVSQAISELDTNPLEASLEHQGEGSEPVRRDQRLSRLARSCQYIDTISYSQNQDVINRLAAIVRDVSKIGGWIVTIFLVARRRPRRLQHDPSRHLLQPRGDRHHARRRRFEQPGARAVRRGRHALRIAIAALISLILSRPALYFVSPYLNVNSSPASMCSSIFTPISPQLVPL
jgi:hypothetical protein